MNPSDLPLGIRNNNPGNLRASYGIGKRTQLVKGFAQFESMADGLQALSALTYDFYWSHGLTTLYAFITRYAPSVENDVAAYINQVCRIIGANPLKARSDDMFLRDPMRALMLMRAIVIVENGYPPAGWERHPEWFSLSDWFAAMHASNKWGNL